ncbi:MAG: GspE/PulE family protein [Acidimicrobiales bacterium]
MAPSKAEIDEARALAREVGLEYVDLDRYPLNAAASSLLPEQLARRQHALAVGWKYGTPVVAVANPDNVLAMDDVRTVIGRDIHAVVACASQIEAYIERMYSHRGNAPGSARVQPGDPTARGTEQKDGEHPATAEPKKDHDDEPAGLSEELGAEVAEPVAEVAEPVAAAGAPAAVAEVPEVELAEELPSEASEVAIAEEGPPEGDADAALAAVIEAVTAISEIEIEIEPEPEDDAMVEEATTAPSLAEVLVESGQVTPEEMEAALREQAATGRSLGEILAELGLVSEEDLIRASATEAGMEFVDLNEWSLDPAAAALLPEAMARRHQALPIGFRGEAPVVALANPSDVFALDDLRTLLGREFRTVVSSPRQVAEYISRMYRRDEETAAAARSAVSQSSPGAATIGLTDLHAAVEDAPIVKYVNLILRQALQERASDVHIEPGPDDLRIRFRIDGVMHEITRSPKAIHGGVTTRLKVMASLDIAEHRIPQDGRISLAAGQRHVDLRVATLPTVHGEKVVMRVLDKSNAMLGLSDLGFLPAVERRYETAFRKPYGTILVTGPTGSGKSTTLYATLNALNSPERNLITVEDPVEYQLPGVNQVQVNPKAGLTFASTLRSILRSDPDIILVGEVRDRETAVIAIEAALTGHLVLSSLHTNDASGTPMRLIEMGVEPFLVGSSLDCVVAQRLARQVCDNCNQPYEPTPEELEALGWSEEDTPPQGTPRFRRAVGCQACSRTGYKGRIAIHELLLISEEIERGIITGASADEINKLGIEQGMVSLRHDGLRKAALGLTSLEEVLRVVA